MECIRLAPFAPTHIVSGYIESQPQTYCGRGLNVKVGGVVSFIEVNLDRESACKPCLKARDHDLNVGEGKPRGGIVVSSPRLGTGRRRY